MKMPGILICLCLGGITATAGSISRNLPDLLVTNIPAGFISWDATIPGTAGQFDVANETGPNSSGDSTAPIANPVALANLALTITFADRSSAGFGFNDFALNPFDGLSFESPTIPIGGMNPDPIKAVLTGTFVTTFVTLFDGSQMTIAPDFTAVVAEGGRPLADGDLAIIFATVQSTRGTPEPSYLGLIAVVLAWLYFISIAPLPKACRFVEKWSHRS